MAKRRRESIINFDQNGYATIEMDGLKYKWNVSEKLKNEILSIIDEMDVSVIATVGHKFMVDIRSMRTNKLMASEEIEMI
jgi:hypothetical protein